MFIFRWEKSAVNCIWRWFDCSTESKNIKINAILFTIMKNLVFLRKNSFSFKKCSAKNSLVQIQSLEFMKFHCTDHKYLRALKVSYSIVSAMKSLVMFSRSTVQSFSVWKKWHSVHVVVQVLSMGKKNRFRQKHSIYQIVVAINRSGLISFKVLSLTKFVKKKCFFLLWKTKFKTNNIHHDERRHRWFG